MSLNSAGRFHDTKAPITDDQARDVDVRAASRKLGGHTEHTWFGNDVVARAAAEEDLQVRAVLQLQGELGNGTVASLMTSMASPARLPGGRDSRKMQFKFQVNREGDAHEAQAERVAAAVLATATDAEFPNVAEPPSLAGSAPPAISMSPQSAGQSVQRMPGLDGEVAAATRDGGQPLRPGERQFFESRFRRDFSDVRLHTNNVASDLADGLGARAFTIGSDIAFAAGEYAPETTPGRHLLAHELTHTVQQAAAPLSATVQRYGTAEHVDLAGEPQQQEVIVIKGIQMTYGEMIAMGDFFGAPHAINSASKNQLKKLVTLIRKEVAKPGSVKDEEWDQATGGKYTELAEKNSAHFAPPNPALIAPSGKARSDHKSQWEVYHSAALVGASKGDKDQALMMNAFADHFLTDAFAAGHLFNKDDAMHQFNVKLRKVSDRFIKAVAKEVWADKSVAKFVSKFETDTFAGWDIDSEGRFASLLEGIHDERPEALSNLVALVIHDRLNEMPGGVEVENRMGDKWSLSGDGTLNAKSKEIGRKAVKQSIVNVMTALTKKTTPPTKDAKFSAAFKAVWDYVPRLTEKGKKTMLGQLALNDPTNATTVTAVSDVIKKKISLIITKLVDMKKLRKK